MSADLSAPVLIVLPSDSMGGAERVALLLAAEIVRSSPRDVCVYFLSPRQAGIAETLTRVQVVYGDRGEWGLWDWLRQRHFQLVYASHWRVNVLLSLLRRLGRLDCARLVTRESTVLADRYHGFRRLISRLAYRTYGAQDLIVAQTDYMARTLSTWLPQKTRQTVQVVPNPVAQFRTEYDLEHYTLPDGWQRETTLVWCARMVAVKQPLLALETLAELHRRGYCFTLLMLGDGPLLREVERAILDLQLTGCVQLCGHQPAVAGFFKSAGLGLLTSRTEGFPNTVLEMLQAGLRRIVVTPCVEALGDIPGVSVADDFSAHLLAAEIIARQQMSAPDPGEIKAFLATRNPRAFLEAIAGPQLGGVDS